MERKERQGNRQGHRVLWSILFVALNVGIIAWTAYREFHVNARTTDFSLGEHGIAFLFAAFLCLAVIFLTETAKLLLTAQSLGEKMTFRTAFETVALGKYYDSITPTGGGGQPFQIYWLHLRGYSARESAVIPASGFITRQLAAVVLALIVFACQRKVEPEAIRYTAYAGLFFCAIPPTVEIAFSLHPGAIKALLARLLKLGEKIHLVKDYEKTLETVIGTLTQYQDGFQLIAGKAGLLIGLMVLSLICRAALCSIPFFVLKALGCPADYLRIFCMTVYIYAAVTLIPTPGNSGVSEGAFYLVFSEVGSSGTFWAMLLWRLICYYSLLLIGLLFLRRQMEVFEESRTKRKASAENDV
ncbi:MAG: flippase-like domain-containing protein [Oscillospiraceae bacterium]|nr:flippase-like domain-containing protein [Oscillospiraceae bacterium]